MTPAEKTTAKTARPWYRRLLRAIWIYVGIPYLTVTLIFVVFQRQLIYRPTVAADLSAASCRITGVKAIDVGLDAADDTRLRGWLLRPKGGPYATADSPLVVYLPGNAGNRFERLNDLLEFTAAGFDVLIFDYRGYGDSEGSPSQRALESDARQIWQYALHLGYKESLVVLFGESLGGAVALSLWSADYRDFPRPLPAAVILNSTFYSMPHLAAANYPWFPFRFLLLDRWLSAAHIGRVGVPVTVFHGTADEIVPFAQGERLASMANHSRFIAVPEGTHNSIPTGQIRQELEQIRTRLTAD